VDYSTKSIIGKRENQEDYGVIKSSGSLGGVLAVIADGMGGQVAGEVASSNVVNSFIENFSTNSSKNWPLKLRLALDKANSSLANGILKNPKLHGMGSTLIAVYIESGSINWVSVGDSILYLYRDNRLLRLNDDHSMVPVLQDSVRSGKITAEEARVHPHRNALRSAVTGGEISLIDLREEPLRLKAGDMIILATDGILTLSCDEISSILNQCKGGTADVITSNLLEAVIRVNKTRQDNTLVGVIKIPRGRAIAFNWVNLLIAISFFVISLICLLAWEKREELMSWFGINKQSVASDATSLPPKVVPILLELPGGSDASSIKDTPTPLAADTAEPSKPKAKPDKRSPPTKNAGKPSEDKLQQKNDATNKSLDAEEKPANFEGGTQPTASAKPNSLDNLSGPAAAVPAARAEPNPKTDGERAKQLLEADNSAKGKSDPDRKE
jgi:serine/threonine protein phosphatase PrpC